MLSTIVVVAALLAAQGEGEGEGEGEGCVTACVDDSAIEFFDGVACVRIACADVDEGSVCGEVSADFGDDCLLADGAACDPGYADGASRCASHACVDGVCGNGENQPEGDLEPTDGTAIDNGAVASSTGCFGCPSTSLVVPFFGALVLRRRRRR